ncbi:eukaryotic translation elongation factor 1 delta a (guanine nucleotide exchange protein) isoform X2 [Hypomesus transpacificus]|uniref:eukaryotic translation elongation factor 1 delta a (guanine nucleotide exchange protein) isoform X2 n=2 Tax=Hypomesus transpacificus TaxID=137520 RepID=UPI001F0758DA|nr:eukaryotic translation elongation factor 1 delta a (guanine nucleotide exchange protein) isoform X2 [Hypomesus transpacificus]
MEHARDAHDQPRMNGRRGGGPQSAVRIGAARGGNGPTIARANLNGDDIHVGRRQRRTRSSQSESQGSGAEEEWVFGSPLEGATSFGQSPVFQGLLGEHVWYNRWAFEQAESAPQRRNGNQPPLSSSPRNQGRGSRTLTFRSRRPQQHQQQGPPEEEHHPSSYSQSPGTEGSKRLPAQGRGRARSFSSEPHEGRGRGYRRARRRGLSETEGRPRRDNINMSGLQCLAQENIWFDKPHYDEAEKRFYEGTNGPSHQQEREASAILQDIAKARQNIQQSLDGSSSHAGGDQELVSRMKSLELENQGLHKVVGDLRAALSKLESRVSSLEKTPKSEAAVPCAKAASVQQVKAAQNGDDDDDDMDLFGSDEEEDAEAERIKEERVAAYAAKKSKKPALIAKSSILLDVKPWDDETDMAKLEECVRTVQMDGLLWGQSKLVPVGYGIKKLQISCVVEDDKVGTDMLEEEITQFEDYVQSVDIAAFNKI